MPSEFDTRRIADKALISDIATDRTLTAYYYTDQKVLDLEKRHLFFRTWQFACHISELAEPGQFTTCSIFDQDVVLVHGRDDEIRGFYNVCLHRGHQLVEGRGAVNRIVCPYHAWTYELDGQLIGVRRGKSTTRVARSDHCLTSVRVDRILDFVFINLDPDAKPLAEYAPGLAEAIEAAVPDLRSFQPTSTWRMFDDPFACNWKALVDNYLECYHCETAHPTFCDMFDCTEIAHEFHRNWMIQHLPTAGKSDTAAYKINLEEHYLDGNFWFLFPNTLIGQLPGEPSLNISRVLPLGAEQCIRDSQLFVRPGADEAHLAARDKFGAEFVGAEDRALVESVQRGMRQQSFNQGLYIIDPDEETFTEEGVRFFHGCYARDLEGTLAAETR